ncbi:receptor activity-modifying protein 3-like isoform X2 [Cheilinus undulatus]|uniref:receptor activity-modifying protein 3-like isoform X2 n=2 Tax=Cheilinus undulatus TaxID=241271 RepID=UPI001BD53E49|nr:receptor activity-modifying protein 3-like isoform X2 [Cheilinus undulatus]
MDPQHVAILKLFTALSLLSVSMIRGLTAGVTMETPSPPHMWCNESRLQREVEVCGVYFRKDMDQVDPRNWCNLTHFISEYDVFTRCTEEKSEGTQCFWPNPLVESFIIRIHKQFFSNCTDPPPDWVDPPDEMLTVLILIPVFLTLAMIAIVVWCSKRSDLLA